MLVVLAALAPAARAWGDCKIGKFATLPITMVGARPITPVRLNGVEVRLMADSGAFYSLIDTAKAAELHLPQQALPFGFQLNGVAGAADSSLATVKSLGIAGATVPGVHFLVASLGDATTHSGLIGQNLLGLRDVEYDFQDGVINLWTPSGCGAGSLAYWAKDQPVQTVTLEERGPHPQHTIGSATLNGRRIRVMFDTGASSTVVSRAAAAQAGVAIDGGDVRSNGRMQGVGGHTLREWRGRFASFKIGDEEVRNVTLTIGERLGGDVDMLLGADFFISHRVYVANSQGRLYLTYVGGPVFGAQAGRLERDAATHTEHPVEPTAAADEEADPADADGFARRGASRLTRQDTAGALADLDHAVALAPKEPRYLLARARARRIAREPRLAMADLDAALALDPGNLDGLVSRAALRLSQKDPDGALADLEAADRKASRQDPWRLEIGEMWIVLGRAAAAVGQFDQWLATHPDNPAIAQALSGRCRARALADIDLDLAQKDCNRAVAMSAGTTGALVSRGLLRLRRGDLDLARADFAAALAITPDLPMARLGRGLVASRQGLADRGAADVAAVRAHNPALIALVRRYGLGDVPPPDVRP